MSSRATVVCRAFRQLSRGSCIRTEILTGFSIRVFHWSSACLEVRSLFQTFQHPAEGFLQQFLRIVVAIGHGPTDRGQFLLAELHEL